MFDSSFDFLTLVIAIVAIIFARKALGQITVLQRRLDTIEAAGVAKRGNVSSDAARGQKIARRSWEFLTTLCRCPVC